MAHDYDRFPELTNRQIEEFGFNSPHPQITEDFEARVVRVHDGDTVTLNADFRDFDFPLRLLDIDAPELNETGGDVSRDWLKAVIEGEKVQVRINRFKRVGKYGRLLGKIISRGLDVGEMAVAAGFAVPFGKKKEALPQPIDKLFALRQWF
jgi:endonuclease YncB( thermonuclease family)